jgi:class 3 adenylate cyclase
MKKTSISSVVCLDIIDFAKKSTVEQQANKKRLDDLVAQAVVDIPENDRMIVDTGHGTIITCSGPLENALEDALFIALTVRDEILNTNTEMEYPLYLLIGINLGSVKVENSVNINEPPKIIGEGLIEAQRIMSFANPNQILVSRAYYDMASKLTLEIAQMFEKYDMHAYEHDIYAVRLLNEKATSIDNVMPISNNEATEDEVAPESSSFNWRNYILPILLAMIMLLALTKWMKADNREESQIEPASTNTLSDQPNAIAPETDTNFDLIMDEEADTQETLEESSNKEKVKQANTPVQKNTTKKSAPKKATSAPKTETNTNEKVVEESKVTESKQEVKNELPTQTTRDEEKSTWDKFKESVKQGADTECTQAQKALNQCN